MEYLGFCVALLMASLFVGLLVADHKLASLQIVTGVVVKKRVLSYTASGGAWEMYIHYETFILELHTVRGEVALIPVLKSQYDETPIGTTIYVKYREGRFLKDKSLLDFAVLRS